MRRRHCQIQHHFQIFWTKANALLGTSLPLAPTIPIACEKSDRSLVFLQYCCAVLIASKLSRGHQFAETVVTNKYLQATSKSKRLAQEKLVDAILPAAILSNSKSNLIQQARKNGEGVPFLHWTQMDPNYFLAQAASPRLED